MDWDAEYLAVSNQLAAWEGWGAKESIMCPEPAHGSALGLNYIEQALASIAHEPSTTAAGSTPELSESTSDPQPQVSSIRCYARYVAQD